MTEIAFTHCSRQQGLEVLEELAALYAEVYAEPPYDSAPKYSRARFLDRTRDQMLTPGFSLVVARVASGDLAGFAFGFTMGPGRWWANASQPPEVFLSAAKFAVVELVVAKEQRGRGAGRALLGQLLQDRPEEFATLAAVVGADAYAMYLRWGWVKVAEFRAEPPYSDALALSLSPHAGREERIR